MPPATARDLPASALGIGPAAVDGGDDLPLPVYVRRDVDDVIDREFAGVAGSRAGGLLVLRGGPASGLSRTLWEALRRHVPDRQTLVLRAPAAFPSGVDDGQPFLSVVDRLESAGVAGPSRPVVVVPDGQEHLGRGLSVAAIERLFRVAPGSVLVVATDAPRLDVPEILAEPTEAWLRAAALPHLVRSQFSDEEVARGTAALPELGHRPGMRALPAWFSAAGALRERYAAGRDAGAAGAAVVAAAVAWRSVGLRTIVPLAALGELTAVVLRTWGAPPFTTADPELRTALAWARKPVAAGRALLQVVPGDREGVRAAGAVVEAVRTDDILAEPDFWTAMLDHVAAVEALDVARVAAARGLDAIAREALAVAQETDETEVRARAALHLGVLEEQLGHPEDAEPAYRVAAASDHPEHAPVAGFHLGGVLEAMQRGAEAEQIYRSVIATRHRDAAAMSAFNLGWMLQHSKRLDEAVEVYELAISSGHPDAAAMSAFNLGWVYEQQRRLREAEAVYRQAMDTGHADVAPLAAVSLGILLERLQRRREAQALYERVVNSGHDEAAAAARLRLQARSRR